MNLHGYSPARRSIVRACTLLLVVVTVIDMGLGSIAYASTSLTVKVSNGGDYSATARSVTLTDTSFGNVTWTCSTVKSKPASRINGRLTSGTHTGNAPVMIGAFSGWAFNNCDGPGGPFAKFKLRSLPYNIAADSTTSGSGKTDLIISGINAFIEWACLSIHPHRFSGRLLHQQQPYADADLQTAYRTAEQGATDGQKSERLCRASEQWASLHDRDCLPAQYPSQDQFELIIRNPEEVRAW